MFLDIEILGVIYVECLVVDCGIDFCDVGFDLWKDIIVDWGFLIGVVVVFGELWKEIGLYYIMLEMCFYDLVCCFFEF